MKVKRFNNLWAMGLFLCIVILLFLYVLKIFFPNIIIGVAELPNIVKFGNFIDSHIWAYYLFNYCVSLFVGYFYVCACCRKSKLTKYQTLILVIVEALMYVVERYLPIYFSVLNFSSLLFMPCIFCLMDKRTEIKYLYSTIGVFIIHNIASILSLEIRNITSQIVCFNSATYTILLIDVYIWLILLYNYYNFRKGGN